MLVGQVLYNFMVKLLSTSGERTMTDNVEFTLKGANQFVPDKELMMGTNI